MDRRKAIASIVALCGGAATVKSMTVDRPTEFFVLEVNPGLEDIDRDRIDWPGIQEVWKKCFTEMGQPIPPLIGFFGATLKKSTDLELFKLTEPVKKAKSRIKECTDPMSDEWTPLVLLNEVLSHRPTTGTGKSWNVHLAPAWFAVIHPQRFLKRDVKTIDQPYHPKIGDRTLRERIEIIDRIGRVVEDNTLQSYQMTLVEQ